jgi:ABC-2 type transport system permease protein
MRRYAANSAERRWGQARWELRLLLRNGEQILLAFIVPVVLLFALNLWMPTSQPLAAVLTASVLATSFTSLAIGTGFERRSGSLRFLATTPLSRLDVLISKVIAQGILALSSAAVVTVVALVLGISAPWLAMVILLPLGAVSFGAWAFWLAGRFRAEAVLAIANGVFLLLIIFGGVVLPAADMPFGAGVVLQWLPSALLADGLRSDTAPVILVSAIGLVIWALIGTLLARRSFRWD